MPLAKPAFTTMTFPTRLLPTHSPRDNPESTRAQLQKYAPTTSGSKAFPQLVASSSQQPGHSGSTGNVANITSSPQQCANKGNTYEKTNCGPGERMPRHTMGCRTQSCEDAYLCGTGKNWATRDLCCSSDKRPMHGTTSKVPSSPAPVLAQGDPTAPRNGRTETVRLTFNYPAASDTLPSSLTCAHAIPTDQNATKKWCRFSAPPPKFQRNIISGP